jgi:vacuolar-type H+-ATPase subunit D/Vma8
MMRRLGHALSRTTRLVNTLEQRTTVRLAAEVVEIRRMLEEREERLGTKRLMVRRATCVV